ncbi:tetratricopeptide repeat protein [Aquincola sp. S2]|uniref:Tetratricopeptide repeat protein n=1 Tax=Pseudaquabacterium terrae TaxID=2732868 RepID=A0ABX2EEG4_9BURK|nr:tetratricopeptide repeat protein [Aquabacterium terrae]NRF66996.1 tetratricopeptide repeat protein [Aquabacterium terrae]
MNDVGSDVFEAARRHFIDGVRAFEAEHYEAAQQQFAASLALVPGRTSTLLNLAQTRLKLGLPQQALEGLSTVLAAEPTLGEAWFHRGHALADLGRDDEALAAYAKVQPDDPSHVAASYHQGLTLNRLRRPAEALACFDRLLQIDPQRAEAWWRRGQTLQELDRHDEALTSYRQALVHDPQLADAWSGCGAILKDRQQLDEAGHCFRQALAFGGDAALNAYLLASVTGGAAPVQAPPLYVRGLFDGYAGSFDAHLVQALHYRAPQLIAQQVGAQVAAQVAAQGAGRRLGAALDLGCGTGLCGPLLAPLVEQLDGVDLSPPMLAKAGERGVYRSLVQADIARHLQQTAERYALLVAADVFIYIGALDAVFEGARRVLQPGGLFCFSVERADDAQDFVLRPSARYAQSRRYLEALAERHGFDVLLIEEQPIREDQRQPVAGLIVTLQERA